MTEYSHSQKTSYFFLVLSKWSNDAWENLNKEVNFIQRGAIFLYTFCTDIEDGKENLCHFPTFKELTLCSLFCLWTVQRKLDRTILIKLHNWFCSSQKPWYYLLTEYYLHFLHDRNTKKACSNKIQCYILQ